MKQLVVGILAHVDSGKTTLSEAILYKSGMLKKLGRVDHGDAFLDSYTLERDRGITIFSKQAILQTEDMTVTLLDTPGHVDFSTEMERTLQVLDYAILVISGTDGVQSHTETLWQLLARHHIPTFIFINKMDLAGANPTAVLTALQQKLGQGCVDFTTPDTPDFYENAAACDENLLESFFQTETLPLPALANAIKARKIFPCYFGSALKLEGISPFLQGLFSYTKKIAYPQAFAAKVFKITRDDQGNRLTHLKVTGGTLKVKTVLDTGTQAEKINQIRIYSGSKYTTADEVLPGTVCAVTGLTDTYAGQGIGEAQPCQTPLLQPVLTYSILLPAATDAHSALLKLRQLEEEDPQLHIVWNEALQELHVQLMGVIQLEVLKRLIFERFQLEVNFGPGNIVYKETIQNTVEGVGHFEPLRHYAEVHLLLQPGQRGSGIQLASCCAEDSLDKNWQRLVLTHLEEKVHLGVLTGSPITDIKITLAAGKAHLKHTEGGDFRQATYRAVRQGLKQAESILLEPWYSFKLEIPTENVGRAMADLQRMTATFDPPQTTAGDTAILIGSAPVALMRDYQTDINAYTRGRGRLVCTLKGYEPCHNTQEVIAALGYDSDSDIENTADSVFCAHGAGFAVKWNEVPNYMHLSSVLRPVAPPVLATPTASRNRAATYCASLEQDKELLAIFQRTYGPLKRPANHAFRSAPKPKSSTSVAVTPALPIGEDYLLVDGYNIIFAWEELKAVAQDNLEAARSQLIHILCNYQGFCRCNLILVFDAYKVKGNGGEVEKLHNITVVYTKEAETADMYIEKTTHSLSKQNRVRVATADGMEQLIILGHGALRVSASAFYQEVKQVEAAIEAYLQQKA
ncbi:MAG: TetM/TetW/TetO/TetS family tetracycline resistance ribosomal protection protein [Oscillospiraceae bacterium]|nr:TetM/TetW/TetO/TetS family tetracycline resistance ribosomal protection protein [Oscillospiraceae bacterium]